MISFDSQRGFKNEGLASEQELIAAGGGDEEMQEWEFGDDGDDYDGDDYDGDDYDGDDYDGDE